MTCETKICPPEKICNPKTTRCVKRSGRIGRKLLPKCTGKVCRAGLVCNPKTGRCKKNVTPVVTPVGIETVKLGNLEFTVGSARGDGSCFFNSIVQQLYTIRDLGIADGTYQSGHALRHRLAESVDIRDFVEVQNGLYAILRVEPEHVALPPNLNFANMNIIEIADELRDQPELSSSIIDATTLEFKKFKREFDEILQYADEAMLEIASKILKVNILIYSSRAKRVYSSAPINPDYPFIFEYNHDLAHYDPMFGTDGRAIYEWREVEDIVRILSD